MYIFMTYDVQGICQVGFNPKQPVPFCVFIRPYDLADWNDFQMKRGKSSQIMFCQGNITGMKNHMVG